MQWIIEAMAVYFGAYLSFNQDLITTEECHAALNPSRYTSEKLGEPSQWSSPRVPYRKGSRVIHWLDHQLRKNSSVSLVDILDMLNTKYKGSITDMPANTKMNNSGDHTLTFESFTEDIEEMLEVDNKIGLIKNINKNLRSAVDGTNITPVTQPMDSGFDDKEINPDPGTISEVEEMFDQQTDVTLESDGQNENSSEITDVSDMFDNEENKSSTQQPTNESDSSQNEITDVDDMFD
jgi:hypothetical protein